MTSKAASRLAVPLVGWLALIAAITLTPTSDGERTLSLCLSCGESGGSELLLNVLLFVPLGALLVRLGASRVRASLIGLGVSAAIEALQWFVVPGRITSLGDLLANASGALIGALLWQHRTALMAPRGTAGRLTVGLYVALVASLLWLGRWSSTPWLPDGTWFVQRTPVRAWSDPHSGTLRMVSVDAVTLPSDRMRDSAIVHRLRTGLTTLHVVEVAGSSTRRLAYTVRLVDARERGELLAMGRHGDALVLHRLTNAARLRLSAPGVRIPTVYAGLTDREVTWNAHLTSGQIAMRSDTIARTFVMPVASVLRGWGVLLPRSRDLTPWHLRVLDLLWAVVLVAPILWWGRLAVRGRQLPRQLMDESH